jgi:glycine hydroxymethyltransferase
MTDAFHAAPLAEADPVIAELIAAELERQRGTLDMIASENVAPRAVLEAQGSVLSNKYADGYPGTRHYTGCGVVDQVEQLAVSRACELFGADHANVQPYSGTSANAAVLRAFCEPGDAVLGFDFNHGGHPSQYDPETFAGHFYRASAYHVSRQTGLVDMDEVADLARQLRPKVIFAGWACYPRVLDFPGFREIADEVGARLVVDMAHFSGLVAGGAHPNPVQLADACTMTVHKTLGGARGGLILCRSDLAGLIDAAVFPGGQGCPLMHVIAAKATTFHLAATETYRQRMERTVEAARLVASVVHGAEQYTGMRVLTGGTDVHQLLIDTGGSVDAVTAIGRLNEVGIDGNAIRIPYDRRAEPASSGIRLGTGPLATRGLDMKAFDELAGIIVETLGAVFEEHRDELKDRVAALTGKYPIYGYLGT